MYPSAVKEPWTGGIIPKTQGVIPQKSSFKRVVAQVSQTQVSTEDKMALRELKRTKKGKPLTTECQRQ